MTSGRAALHLAVGLLAAGNVWAQAHPLPREVGALSLGFQAIDNTGHRLSDGYFLDAGYSVNRSVSMALDYGLTERLTVSVGVPYVRAKYTDVNPPPANLPVDTRHEWHGGLQDFALSARYNAVARGPLALTPSASLVLPSHAYNYEGEAVLGRRLRELQLGVHAARTLDEITPRLEVQAGYVYSLVERPRVDVPNNRSNAYAGLSYVVTTRLQVHGAVEWQRTHGGLRAGDGPGGALGFFEEIDTPLLFAEHDRLLRDNYLHLEAGATFSLGIADVHAAWLGYASGTDTHAGHAITVGASLYFGRLPGRAARLR